MTGRRSPSDFYTRRSQTGSRARIARLCDLDTKFWLVLPHVHLGSSIFPRDRYSSSEGSLAEEWKRDVSIQRRAKCESAHNEEGAGLEQ